MEEKFIFGNQSYNALKFHIEDIIKDNNIDIPLTNNPKYALFSKNYFNKLQNLNKNKNIDYCFIGSINSNFKRREWVIDFARNHFTKNSIFLNTDKPKDWEILGDFDYTNKKDGFSPKKYLNYESREIQFRNIEDNLFYFETMANSKFTLCPAGDSPWSFRFYECLMCDSIPILESKHHSFRTIQESKLNYKFFLYNQPILFDIDFINHNNNIFKKFHIK